MQFGFALLAMRREEGEMRRGFRIPQVERHPHDASRRVR